MKRSIIYIIVVFFTQQFSCSNQDNSSSSKNSIINKTSSKKPKTSKTKNNTKPIIRKNDFFIPQNIVAKGILIAKDSSILQSEFKNIKISQNIPMFVLFDSKSKLYFGFIFPKTVSPQNSFSCVITPNKQCFYTNFPDKNTLKFIKSKRPSQDKSYLEFNFKQKAVVQQWAKDFSKFKKLKLKKLKITYKNQKFKLLFVSKGQKISFLLRNSIFYFKQLLINERRRYIGSSYGQMLAKSIYATEIKEKRNMISVNLQINPKTFIWAIKQLNKIIILFNSDSREAKYVKQ